PRGRHPREPRRGPGRTGTHARPLHRRANLHRSTKPAPRPPQPPHRRPLPRNPPDRAVPTRLRHPAPQPHFAPPDRAEPHRYRQRARGAVRTKPSFNEYATQYYHRLIARWGGTIIRAEAMAESATQAALAAGKHCQPPEATQAARAAIN